MELKDVAGNRDLYDVMSKQKKKQKKIDAKVAKNYHQEKSDVFGFINNKLGGKKGTCCKKFTHALTFIHLLC